MNFFFIQNFQHVFLYFIKKISRRGTTFQTVVGIGWRIVARRPSYKQTCNFSTFVKDIRRMNYYCEGNYKGHSEGAISTVQLTG